MAKNTEVSSVPQDKDLSIAQIQAGLHKAPVEAGESIEQVTNMDAAELEAFMEDELLVEMGTLPDGMLGVPITVVPTPQWVIGGHTQKIKRKYVEVLARARTTKYRQYHNPMNPADSRPVPMTTPSYPFVVKHDPSPRGHAWLQAIINSPG